jgi:hypothetical protein
MGLFRRRKRFYFLHIPKTAGSSLGQALVTQYRSQEVLNCPLEDLLRMDLPQIQSRRAYCGHWGISFDSLLGQPIPTISVLRDPFERVVSAVRYSQREGLPREFPEIREVFARGDWNEIVHHPVISGLLENIQCLYLGSKIDLRPYLTTPPPGITPSGEPLPYLEYYWAKQRLDGSLPWDEVAAEAKRRLDQLEGVGIFEQLPETTHSLCRLLGLRTPPVLPQKRISPERRGAGQSNYRESFEIPADAVRRIDELTARDRELYEYAQARFTRQLAERRRSFWPLVLTPSKSRPAASGD